MKEKLKEIQDRRMKAANDEADWLRGRMKIREILDKTTGIIDLWAPLNALEGCLNGSCDVLGRPGGQRTQGGCNCLRWLHIPDHRIAARKYLKAKRELG